MFVKASDSDEPGIGTWWGGKGVFVDFTNAATREHWKTYLKENVLDYGTSSVWNDNCEYDSMIDKDCRCSFEGKGGTIGQLKSVMSNIMCQTAVEAVHETYDNVRPYIVCRSGHCGIQRYAQTWAGDNLTCWDSLKYNIATILGMSLSGVANQGCDIGGFFGPAPEAELLVRWIQNGIFQPRFFHPLNQHRQHSNRALDVFRLYRLYSGSDPVPLPPFPLSLFPHGEGARDRTSDHGTSLQRISERSFLL